MLGKNMLTAGAIALILGGAALATASPAAAEESEEGEGWGGGAALGAGLLGLAAGTVIAGRPHDYGGYYAPAYQPPAAYYRGPVYGRSHEDEEEDEGYARPRRYAYRYAETCRSQLRWSRDEGRYVRVERCW